MFNSYLMVSFRNLVRNKFYTGINILGLAIGLTCAILTIIYSRYEFSFDTHNENYDRISRILRETHIGDSRNTNNRTSGLLASSLMSDLPVVESAGKAGLSSQWVTAGDRVFLLDLCVGDDELLNIFTIPFIAGDPATALDASGSIVIPRRRQHVSSPA